MTVCAMQLETKFLHLRSPVTIGSRFGDWEVTWLGGWTRDRLSYLVMVVKIQRRSGARDQPQSCAECSALKHGGNNTGQRKEDEDARSLRSNRTRTDRRRD